MKPLKTLLYPIAITATLSLSACSIFGVYTIDLPQGTPITQQQAQQIQPGMNKNQVIYLIGSPAVRDTLAPNRWDYIYDYTPGTYGKREGKEIIHNASQHLIIYFDESDIVTRVEGVETLPVKNQ
ncbi:outer membrane protein assembly factor BamE [Psychrobacter sp. FDAARGOS_221]|uniref:outer membrane protein assembly factor BamE n=1 Tax=Psychrobacter sp. FDAARGOS_221 TaxID=1975705 RepID=UPI000BB53F85|nr:outer membrane protein assembly factor BamE [Psychrobacter sp. FDAARGOS_221]PNK61275.1 outer membrane protein assembly factor BamE [Psychrobacter sp. FDAARGOS_221]